MVRVLLPVVLASASTAWEAKASTINEAVEYASVNNLSDNRPFTLGYEFTTNATLDINALGFWVDGQSNDHQVGIWTSTGTLLASTTVLSTDAITGNFRYSFITDLILAPGTYVIGGEYLGNNDPFPSDATGVTTIPEFTWVTDEQINGTGLNFPTDATNGSYGPDGILLVDFSVSSAATPEPVSMLLTGAGLLGFGLLRKLRRRP